MYHTHTSKSVLLQYCFYEVTTEITHWNIKKILRLWNTFVNDNCTLSLTLRHTIIYRLNPSEWRKTVLLHSSQFTWNDTFLYFFKISSHHVCSMFVLRLHLHMSHFAYACKTEGEKRNLLLNFNTSRKVWWCFFRTSTQFSIWFSTCLI